MEADYEANFRGRRFELFPKRRPLFCPPVPLVSMVSMLVRRVCVEFLCAAASGQRSHDHQSLPEFFEHHAHLRHRFHEPTQLPVPVWLESLG